MSRCACAQRPPPTRRRRSQLCGSEPWTSWSPSQEEAAFQGSRQDSLSIAPAHDRTRRVQGKRAGVTRSLPRSHAGQRESDAGKERRISF
eukprot:749351-Hanusia_phi.AAC.3